MSTQLPTPEEARFRTLVESVLTSDEAAAIPTTEWDRAFAHLEPPTDAQRAEAEWECWIESRLQQLERRIKELSTDITDTVSMHAMYRRF